MLRKQLDKDPQFQVALELVQDKGMYNRIITPADAKVRLLLPVWIARARGGGAYCFLTVGLLVAVNIGNGRWLQAVPCG